MNISLTEDQENFVNELISSGTYFSASEVVRDGLRLLKEREAIRKMRFEELKGEIMLGAEDLRAGRSQTFYSGDEVFEEIKKRGEKKLSEKRNGK